MRVPWTARRSNRSILKEINPEYSLEGLMLRLQYFGHLMRRADSLEKTLMLGEIEGKRRRGWQRMRWLDGIMDPMDMSVHRLREMAKNREPGVLQSMGSQRVEQDLTTEQQGILQEDQALGSKHTGVNALSEARMHTRRLCSLKEPRGHSLQDCPEVGEGANITKFSGISPMQIILSTEEAVTKLGLLMQQK